MTKPKKAKKLILDLLDAGRDSALVQSQDGGDKVDEIYSREPGHEEDIMTLAEAERLTDLAIRAAYRELTGSQVSGDPVEFIQP